MQQRVGQRVLATAIVASVLGAACSSGGTAPPSSPAREPSASAASASPSVAASPSAASPTADLGVINGKFDVGGHELFLSCKGTTPPTVIYMHGAIQEPSVIPHANGDVFLAKLNKEHRVCVYDRRNIGLSDQVPGPQTPQDALDDLHGLLAAAKVEPPYVLLGASFGGILAYLYLNTYPDEVVGAVMLDAQFPDELALDSLFPPEDRYEAFDKEDETGTPERISHFKAQTAAQPFIGKEPDIPLTYLASGPEGYDVNDYGLPEYDKKIIEAQQAYVDRFSPGKRIVVQAPHFMEPAIPDQIVDELREVIEAAGY
jgi:pimeloyl-ACP methyl ester carboxylesterase